MSNFTENDFGLADDGVFPRELAFALRGKPRVGQREFTVNYEAALKTAETNLASHIGPDQARRLREAYVFNCGVLMEQ